METKNKVAYLAGPMNGYEEYNFPAFFKAEEHLKQLGFDVINPARIDQEELGFNPKIDTADAAFLNEAAKRDLNGVIESDCLILLQGWEKSKGANAEIGVAKWLNKPIYLYPSLCLLSEESVLDKAKRITTIDRQKDYGHPSENFLRIANLWNSYLKNRKEDGDISVEDVAWMMVLFKIARDQNKPTHDNLVDAIGYTRTLAMIRGIE
jgi:nucleoside 2-deoxyribosyltransferase